MATNACGNKVHLEALAKQQKDALSLFSLASAAPLHSGEMGRARGSKGRICIKDPDQNVAPRSFFRGPKSKDRLMAAAKMECGRKKQYPRSRSHGFLHRFLESGERLENASVSSTHTYHFTICMSLPSSVDANLAEQPFHLQIPEPQAKKAQEDRYLSPADPSSIRGTPSCPEKTPTSPTSPRAAKTFTSLPTCGYHHGHNLLSTARSASPRCSPYANGMRAR